MSRYFLALLVSLFANAWRARSRFEFINSCAETMSPRRFSPCELRVCRMVSRLCVAAVARLEVSSTSCSTAWTDSFPASAGSLLPPVVAMDEPWSAVALAPDFPFFPLLFVLGGGFVAVEAELPDAAVPDDAPASAGGGVDGSAGFVESGADLPAGVFGFALLASAGGV